MPRLRAGAVLALTLLVSILVLAACGGSASTTSTSSPASGATVESGPTLPQPVSLRRVTFMAGFTPQANLPFVAVYVAKARGFFDEEGLAVEVQHSAGQDEHLKLLLESRIDFTTGTAAQLLRRREQDVPIRGVALFGQRGDQGYVARADSGIRTPSDFRGRSVGFKAGVVPAELLALLANAGLSRDDVRLQAVGFDARVFIEGAVDVFPVFLNNEPDTIRRAGVAINVIDPTEFNVATLGLMYLAREQTVEQDPELVRGFLRATLRGADYASKHLDEAVAITRTYAEALDPDHQRFLLETDLANAKRADGIGRFDLAQFEALEALLRKYEVLTEDVDVARAVDASFIDALYAQKAVP